jgi:hypothetical protein
LVLVLAMVMVRESVWAMTTTCRFHRRGMNLDRRTGTTMDTAKATHFARTQ